MDDLLKNTKSIAELISPELLATVKCTACGIRYKERNSDWCKWCGARGRRKQKIQHYPQSLVDDIRATVEPEYLEAEISDFAAMPFVLKNLTDWNGENLYFFGDCGTGKTRAMYALLKTAIVKGYCGRVIDFGQLCREIRAAYDTKVSEQAMREKFLQLDVLMIDDMGLKSTVTDYEYSVFYDILDTRLSNRLATIISSNKEPYVIGEAFDKRIASRLNLFKVLQFTGKDWRTNG